MRVGFSRNHVIGAAWAGFRDCLRQREAPLKMPSSTTNICVGRADRPPGRKSMSLFRLRPLLALCAVAAVLAFTLSDADARAGRGGSFGSRGGSTFSSPPSTATAPGARPIEQIGRASCREGGELRVVGDAVKRIEPTNA